jgi:hypothetical protein
MIRFTYALLGPAFREARVTDGGGQEVALYPGPLSDPLAELTWGVAALLLGAETHTVVWQDEPGEWRWLLVREGDAVHVTLLRFEETFSRKPDTAGRCLFEATDTLASFAGQVKSQLQALLETHGVEGYRELAGQAFPLYTYERLANLTRERKRSRRRTRS